MRTTIVVALSILLLLPILVTSASAADNEKKPFVYLIDFDGTVNAALADFITKGIAKAEQSKAQALIIRMDTPGGMVSVTKKIVKSMENAKVPVIVYVAPSGSSAASAGALITMAADIAAMAPGTNIGAAHPVAAGGEKIDSTMAEKVMNDLTAYMRGIVAKKGRNTEWVDKAIRESVSVTAKEALDLKVIDLTASSLPDLLTAIDGRDITKNGVTFTLHTKDAKIDKIKPGWRFKILDTIAHPNVAYVLMIVGMIGIIVEISTPGAIFPGVAGGICLLLAFFASQALPINYVGVMLLILSIILFIVELKVPSYGALGLGAVISFILGSIMLFDSDESAVRVSWSVIIPVAVAVSLFFFVAMSLVFKAWMSKPRTGNQGLIGEIGTAITEIENSGKIEIRGEYWNAKADRFIPRGERVRVTQIDGLQVMVTRV